MRGANGSNLDGYFDACAQRKTCFFCQLPAELTKDLIIARPNSLYQPRTTLFAENQLPRGVFVLCEGEAKISLSSSSGKTLILRIARAGEILGLMPALSGKPHCHAAETITPCHIGFVRREDLVRFVAAHPQALEPILQQLTLDYEAACEQLRILGLASTASAKLARLLLEWHSYAEHNRKGEISAAHLTHEEIGSFIGASRETVTRTLNEFKEQRLIHIDSSGVTISDRAGLEAIVAA